MKKILSRVLCLVSILVASFLITGCLEEGTTLEFEKFPQSVYITTESKDLLNLPENEAIRVKINGQSYTLKQAQDYGCTITGYKWDANFHGMQTLVIKLSSASISFTYEVKANAGEVVTSEYDIVWEGTGADEKHPYLITNEAELRGLAAVVNNKLPKDLLKDDPVQAAALKSFTKGLVNHGEVNDNYYHFEGKFFKLQNDIHLSKAWEPIGEGYRYQEYVNVEPTGKNQSNLRFFSGTFDGNGKTIYGLTNKGYNPEQASGDYTNSSRKLVEDGYVFGLFGLVYGATIKNLNMADVQIEGDLIIMSDDGVHRYMLDSAAAVVGYTLSKKDTRNKMPENKPVVVENCTAINGKVEGFDAVAGIIGRAYAKVSIINCVNSLEISCSRTDGGKASGMVGIISTEFGADSLIKGCVNNGRIIAGTTGKATGGAMCGQIGVGGLNVTNCKNTARVYSCVDGKLVEHNHLVVGDHDVVYLGNTTYGDAKVKDGTYKPNLELEK